MSRYWITTAAKMILAFSVLMIIPLLQTEGQICENNEHSSTYECTPYNMLCIFFWNLSNFFDHHEGTVIGIATFFLALITAFLWDATRDLVHGAEKTAERQLRAYVHLDKCEVVVTPDGTIRQFISLRNFLQTPAHKYSHNIWFKVWNDKNKPPDFKPFERLSATATIAPSAIVELDLSFDIIKVQGNASRLS